MPEDMKSLVKNPLGIIALFIALIYGFAALLLGLSASQLLPEERAPLIWFIVLFPIVVLGTFHILVTRHHGKLYAPKDYQKDDSFLKTLSVEEQEERLTEEIVSSETLPVALETENNVMFSRKPSDNLEQESKKLDISVNTLRFKYKQAENLALNKISETDCIILERQVRLGANKSIVFDAVFSGVDSLIVIEVKYLRNSFISPVLIREVLYKAMIVWRGTDKESSFKLIIAIVLDNDDSSFDELKTKIEKLTDEVPFSTDVRFYYLNALKNESKN